MSQTSKTPATETRISQPVTVKRVQIWSFSFLFLAAFAWSINKVDLTPQGLIDIFRGWPETQNLLARMWPPFIPSEDLNVIWKAVWDTFLMAFAGTFIGLVLGIPLGLLAAKNVMPLAFIRFLSRVTIVFARAIPALVFALFFVRVYGIGPLAGILALGLHAIGMIGKLITDAAEEIDSGPREGVTSTGASGFQDTISGVWSQIVPPAIGVGLYRLEIDFRSANILGWVGAGGIGVIFRGYQGNLRYQELLGVTLLITLMVILMEFLSAITRHTLLGTTQNTVKKTPMFGGRFLSGFRSQTTIRGGHLERKSIGTKLANIILRRRQPTIAETSKLDSGADPNESGSPYSKKPKVRLTQPWTSDRIKVNLVGLGLFILLVLSFTQPGDGISSVWGELFTGSGKFPEFLGRLIPDDWAWFTDRIVSDMLETIAIGLASTTIALIFAIPFAFLAASNTAPGKFIYRISRFFNLSVRCLPELVLAVIFVAAIGPGPKTGTIAMAIGMFGFVVKLFSDSIEEAKQNIRDGVTSAGSTRVQESVTGVLPQVAPSLFSNSLYLFDVSIRSSTVIGIVGGGGIGFLTINAAKTLNFDTLGGIIFCIFVVVYAIELLSSWLRRTFVS